MLLLCVCVCVCVPVCLGLIGHGERGAWKNVWIATVSLMFQAKMVYATFGYKTIERHFQMITDFIVYGN